MSSQAKVRPLSPASAVRQTIGHNAGTSFRYGPELRSVHKHMLGLGLGALAHANWQAAFHSWDNEYWPQLSVLQAAHSAEILIKARIAQAHPLLIFARAQ